MTEAKPVPNVPKNWVKLKDAVQFGRTPGLDGPPCIWDNAPTRKTGSCWTCIACGETTGCG